jgi:hypothetical protein
MPRFPNIETGIHDLNPAIQVYGRRFFKDQTPVEYLAEFLLVFASPKSRDGEGTCSFPLYSETPSRLLSYFPPFRLGLKLFSFLGVSKLETRHPVHMKAFRRGLEEIAKRVDSHLMTGSEGVRLLQGLFSGFVGVSGDRTWTAHTFLPASRTLLAREVLWKHSGGDGALRNLPANADWDDAWNGSFFRTDAHSFMARGGELLFLQLLSVFNKRKGDPVSIAFSDSLPDTYQHLDSYQTVDVLREGLQENLTLLLDNGDRAIGPIAKFVDRSLAKTGVVGEDPDGPKSTDLGWVHRSSETEALLFAWELNNICIAQRSGLQKTALIRDLCVVHVLRSLCFQSARVCKSMERGKFAGSYCWIVCSPEGVINDNAKRLAINCYEKVEGLLFRSLREFGDYSKEPTKAQLNDGDENAFLLFRKLGKQIGLVVPKKGPGMRMVLPAHLVRVFVAALIPPGVRMRLDRFYDRLYAHFGIAIGQRQASLWLKAIGENDSSDVAGLDSSWFEEELRRGGYLIPLSDAVSLVTNPFKAKS